MTVLLRKLLPRRPHVLFVLSAILVFTIIGFAQEAAHFGKIIGTASGIGGHPLAGASVTLSDLRTGGPIITVATASNGTYIFPAVKYGNYDLTAACAGYESTKPKTVRVASATIVVDIHLKQFSEGGVASRFTSAARSDTAKNPPSFTPAGISGSINGSGYSSAASSEEASHVMDLVVGLRGNNARQVTPIDEKADCAREGDLSRAVVSHPNSFEANHRLGEFYLGHGDRLQSIRYLMSASRIQPENIDNSRDLAAAYLDTGQYATAMPLLQHLLQNNGKDPALHLLMAKAYAAANMSHGAIAEYKLSANLDAGEQNIFDCGIGLIDMDSAGEAQKMFAAAVIKHPGSANLWLGLGIAEYLLQRKADAIQSLLHAVDIDPEYLPPYSFLANLSGTSNEADTKIADRLAHLIALHPDHAEAHYDYALALWKHYKRTPDAQAAAEIEAQLKLAIAQNSQDADAHYLLGVIDADMGDYAHAAEELSQSVQLNPDNAESHYRLALAYRSAKETGLADRQFKIFEAMRTKKTNPDDAKMQKLASQLVRQRGSALHCPSVR